MARKESQEIYLSYRKSTLIQKKLFLTNTQIFITNCSCFIKFYVIESYVKCLIFQVQGKLLSVSNRQTDRQTNGHSALQKELSCLITLLRIQISFLEVWFFPLSMTMKVELKNAYSNILWQIQKVSICLDYISISSERLCSR